MDARLIEEIKQDIVFKIHWMIKARKITKLQVVELIFWDCDWISRSGGWFCMHFCTHLQKNAHRLEDAENISLLSEKKSIWGLYEGLYRNYLTNKKSFQRSINAICFRDWTSGDSVDAQILAMLLCPHWWIWNITYLIRRTCQFWEPKMWWRYYVKSEIELVQITRRNSWTAPMVVQREHWFGEITRALLAIWPILR